MEIRLDLSRHCIETAARLRVEQLIRSYFRQPALDTGHQIRALTLFLEQADFSDLRHAMARETGPGSPIARLIFPTDLNRLEIRFYGRSLFPLAKHQAT